MNAQKLGLFIALIAVSSVFVPSQDAKATEYIDLAKSQYTEFTLPIGQTLSDVTAYFSSEEKENVFAELIDQDKDPVFMEPLYEYHDPQIRVGLYWMRNGHLEITSEKDYTIQNESGEVLAELSGDQIVTAKYNLSTKIYTVRDENGVILESEDYIRFVPVYAHAPFTLVNYYNPHPWYKGENDNMYRGVIEFRFIEKAWKTYVINELYIEDYVRGIGEANNTYDKEFYKVLAVVTRSYALHYTLNDVKYPGMHFDVRPTTHDQLYRGYNYEKHVPTFQEAVTETANQVVMYDGKLAVTPYFAQSAGRTYSYKAVWGGYLPWLQGTHDKYYGNALVGHGVGMPLMGAVYLVRYDDLSYEEVIKHYYQNIEIKPLVI